MNFDSFDVLSFDCYGTLVDWEGGILGALRPLLDSHAIEMSDDRVLETYARIEESVESGPYMKYRDVLREVVRRFGRQCGFTPDDGESGCIVDSFGDWRPFGDTVEALRGLQRRFKLVILSNVDDDLFALTGARLGIQFDAVVTAEQAGSYKPSPNNFEVAFKRVGLPRDRILHVAQSIFHDHVPAKRLGLATVWVNRRGERKGTGATPPAEAEPDLTVPDLQSLVAAMGLQP